MGGRIRRYSPVPGRYEAISSLIDSNEYLLTTPDPIPLLHKGGGQPNDTGTLILPSSPPLKVENVQRTGLRAVHHVRVPPELVHSAEEILKKGVKVEMEVDWERRYDQVSSIVDHPHRRPVA